jgi:hypothetical protein
VQASRAPVVLTGVERRRQDRVPFMCECGAGLCDERVWLTVADYDEPGDGPLLASGHEPASARRLGEQAPGRERRNGR